jgi:hypothetical protein
VGSPPSRAEHEYQAATKLDEFHEALSCARAGADWIAATGQVALHWDTTSRAERSHWPHCVATPNSNWMSSKLIPARAWRAISRSETRRQTQTIMAKQERQLDGWSLNENESHWQ